MKVIDLINYNGDLSNSAKAMILSALERDQVLVYPTDTLYGLGVDACSQQAVDKLYLLKEREDSPISVLVQSTDLLIEMAEGLSSKARGLIQTFLPGAMTVICRSNYPFTSKLYSKNGTIGFRVPSDTISRMIPEILGRPVTTTSVNPMGQTPANSLSQVRNYYGDELSLMLDIGPMDNSLGSTVVDLTSQPFKILREGEISRQSLQDFLN